MSPKIETMEKLKITTDLFKTPENLALLNAGKGYLHSVSKMPITMQITDELIKIIRDTEAEDVSGLSLHHMDARVEDEPIVYDDVAGFYFNGNVLGRVITYNVSGLSICRNGKDLTLSLRYPKKSIPFDTRIKLNDDGYPATIVEYKTPMITYEYEMHPVFNLPLKIVGKREGAVISTAHFRVVDTEYHFAYRIVYSWSDEMSGFSLLTIKKKV